MVHRGKYQIYLHRDAEKTLLKFPKDKINKISSIIDRLSENPILGVKMHGRLSHLRKIKVGDYRIIYKVLEDRLIIEIIEIASRGNIFYD